MTAPRIVVDTNETIAHHRGYRFPNDHVMTLDCADYSELSLLDTLRIERKSLADFLGCVGGRREQFEDSLARMTLYPLRYLVLEFGIQHLAAGGWSKPKVSSASAIGSLIAWESRYRVVPLLCNDAAHARAMVAKLVARAVAEKPE